VIHSMTGYGKGLASKNGLEIVAEIRSLNNRHLDVNFKLPRNLAFVEEELRKLMQGQINRGRLDVSLFCSKTDKNKSDIVLNESMIDMYLDMCSRLEQKYLISNNVNVLDVLKLPDVFLLTKSEEDVELLGDLAKEAFLIAFTNIMDMKKVEGEELRVDLMCRVRNISKDKKAIESRAPLLINEYRQKLSQRLKDLLLQTDLDEMRFNTEIVYFSEKSNITEEIVRLESHLLQFEKTMLDGGSIGRKLEFLVQEINREVNTISSKVGDLTIVNLVIDIKSELEKIREQILNIE